MSTVDLSRRNLFRGKLRVEQPIRPPCSLNEAHFTNNCTQCNQCIDACETRIIIKSDAGFPVVDFNAGEGECTFCDKCVKACPSDALNIKNSYFKTDIKIGDSCLTQHQIYCQSCKDSCDHQAIKFQYIQGAVPTPQIDTDLCNSCGACVGSCPQNTIKITQTATE